MFVLQQRNFVYNEEWRDKGRYRFILEIKGVSDYYNVYRNTLLGIRG